MKKIFLSALLFVMLQLINVEILKSCPSGWTEHTVSKIFTYTGGTTNSTTFSCRIEAKYCCYYDPYLKIDSISVDSISSPDNYCLWDAMDQASFKTWLQDMIAEDAALHCIPAYPPCDDSTSQITYTILSFKSCWKKVNVKKCYGNDCVYIPKLASCSTTATCITTYKICYDYSVNPPILRNIKLSSDFYGTPPCSTTIPVVPSSQYPEDEAWETYCFVWPCN